MARERWGSRLGVILAVAGSAIGLGNFLRFPGQAMRNGGGAFMIPYFVSLVLLGLPLMWIEWTVGRLGGGFGHSTAPGMFHTLWNKNRFIKYFGVIGIFGPVAIFIYYTYIESWLLGYSYFAITGKYAACTTEASVKAFLNGYRGLAQNEYFSSLLTAYVFFLITFAANVAVVCAGIQKGIERVCKYGLAMLFLFGAVLVVRVFLLGTPDPALPDRSVEQGLGSLWNPRWSELGSARVWLAAAGQIFFTLSVGIGVILTYASYLTPKDDVALSGLTAASANEVAEVILGGSIVIPAAVAFFGVAATKEIATRGTFDLGAVAMPLLLNKIPLGGVFGFMWFALLFLAGVTSSISLAQPAVAFLEDEFNFSRRKSAAVFAVVTFVLCQPVIFFLGHGVLDELDFWAGNFFLVVFATIETILFGWVFGIDKAWTELHVGSDITIPRVYRFIIKYVTPLFLLIILGAWVTQEALPVLLMRKMAGTENEPVPATDIWYVRGTRAVLVLLFAVLAFAVWRVWRRRRLRGGTP
jgi:SNF family Na+-dependent transporter